MKTDLIGQGRTAEIFAWGEAAEQGLKKLALKLYFPTFPTSYVEYEAEVGKAVHEAGVPSPQVYGVVDRNGRKGIIYERISGSSLLKLLEKKPWKLQHYACMMARLHHRIHTFKSKKLPQAIDWYSAAINQSGAMLGDKADLIIKYMKTLGAEHRVCHGDFHPDNILVSGRDLVAIDWNNAHVGEPYEDVARTCLMLKSTFMPPGTPWLFLLWVKVMKGLFYKLYLGEYLRLSKAKTEDIENWILPVAAARLREEVPGEKQWLLAIIERELRRINI